jgi:copper resistance protein B
MDSGRRSALRVLVCLVFLSIAARAAAQSESHESAPLGWPAHGMLEDPFNRSILLDELEARDEKGDPLSWDLSFWAGHAFNRLAIRTEGDRHDGSNERAELQVLWAHTVARWWDVVAGARADFDPGSSKNWAAFGVQGLAPYRFALEATTFIADGGDTAGRVEAEYELLITQRLILQPQVELNWYGQSDPERGVGAGLSNAEFALRLRYEFRREIAPYVGLVRERRFGATADLARVAGADTDDTSLALGVRLRF